MTYDMIAKFDYDACCDAIVEELELFSNMVGVSKPY